MSVTMRVVRGRKVKNPKYTIRKSIKVHSYGTENGYAIRTNESGYIGKTENDPKNLENVQPFATLTLDTDNGTRRAYVPIT